MIAGVIKRQGDVGRGIKEESLGRIFASGDGLAHIFQITVADNGVEQDLTGCSVQGYFIRSADDTVLITGSADGSVATVVLPAACYAVYGPFKLIIRVVNGSTRSTVYVASGYVTRSSTDTIIDPGHVIPDITELLAQIDAMERATAAAEAAATKAVRYDSAQSLQDSEKGTARTNIDAVSSAELATVSDDVADLKSAFDEDVALLDGKISMANTRISTNATDIDDLETDMETAQRDIRSLDGEYIDLSVRMGMLEPEATAEDVGKALIAKTVGGGKVTEYEFGETTEIDDTAGEGDTDKTWSADKIVNAINHVDTIPNDVRVAMDTLFSKAAYADADAASSYAIFHAWATANPVTSITAVFTQGSAVIYDIDSLDTLKQYLVVTAKFSDGTTATITHYTLSGTLTVGTSMITVSYGGQTDSFSVSVTGTVDNGTFSFSDGTTVTILNDHVTVMIGSAEGGKFINLSSLSSNTSDPTSVDNIDNKSTTFMSIAAGETVTAMIKNCVSDNTGWINLRDSSVEVGMNLRKQNGTTSILLSGSAPVVYPKEYTVQDSDIHYDKKPNDTKTYTASTSVIAGCLVSYIGSNFPAGTTIDYDIAVSVS